MPPKGGKVRGLGCGGLNGGEVWERGGSGAGVGVGASSIPPIGRVRMFTGSGHGNKRRPISRSALHWRQATLRAAPSSMLLERASSVLVTHLARFTLKRGPTGRVADMTCATGNVLAGPISTPMGGLLNL